MELGEIITVPSLLQEFTEKCPFREECESGPERADEALADDDLPAAQEAQTNDGGTLGKNVEAGSAGVADGGPCPPDDFLWRAGANDSKRGRKTFLQLREYKDASGGDFPFTVAAHHLIPGNAALYRSPVFDYMAQGKQVTSDAGHEYEIAGHIGYDVNGCHNAVWLPGNYAIKTARPEHRKGDRIVPARIGTTPIADTPWSGLPDAWQFAYVAGACKAAGGQFHDTHEVPYSASVRKNLIKIASALSHHLDACPLCKDKKPRKVPPPFCIKRRLFALSKKLRTFVTGPPSTWKRPWFTSERWSAVFFKGGKITLEFRRAYAEAEETAPHVVGPLTR